jgi:hypothetical protein
MRNRYCFSYTVSNSRQFVVYLGDLLSAFVTHARRRPEAGSPAVSRPSFGSTESTALVSGPAV